MSDDEPRAARDALESGRRIYDRLDRDARLVAIWHVAGFTTSEIAAHLSITDANVIAMIERLREIARGPSGGGS